MEKREGTERRVCVHFIYMVEATERCGTYLLIPVKRELVACQSTKGGNRKGGRGSERKKKRKSMKDSIFVVYSVRESLQLAIIIFPKISKRFHYQLPSFELSITKKLTPKIQVGHTYNSFAR